MTPLAKVLDLSLHLLRAADGAGLSLVQARRMLAQLAMLPTEVGDALLAEARRERIRELSAKVRRGRRSR